MKLYTPNYKHPDQDKGIFKNVFIEDVGTTERHEYLEVEFEMYALNDNKKQHLGFSKKSFYGMNDNPENSAKAVIIEFPNPKFDKDAVLTIEQPIIEPEFLQENMFTYMKQNAGKLPTGYKIIDYGDASFENVQQYFKRGSIGDREMHITQPLAFGFILQKLIFFNENVGKQFKFI